VRGVIPKSKSEDFLTNEGSVTHDGTVVMCLPHGDDLLRRVLGFKLVRCKESTNETNMVASYCYGYFVLSLLGKDLGVLDMVGKHYH
jgi:hypothetical protein